jgi:UDP-N-acetylglucosamine/UDP-N-acetyl-alpha-D-glucosaminouronate 4-epimerase
MPQRHVLITGGAGFIGSSLARALVARGDGVRVIDNFSSGRRENLGGLSPADVQVIDGDILDPAALARAVAGVSVIFHEAAIPSVPRSVAEPEPTNAANVTGTLNVLQAARAAGVRRVVYAASSSAYGDTPTLPKVETMPTVPLSPYAVSKLAGELYCRTFHHVYGLETVALRYFNVFGPRQDPQSQYAAVVPRFVTAGLTRQAAVVYGDGEQSRDFCFIDNVVAANLLAADAPDAPGRVFNIACGEAISLNRVLDLLETILDRKIERRHEPARAGDVKHSLADISAARSVLGYQAAVSFAEGLRRTVRWFDGSDR